MVSVKTLMCAIRIGCFLSALVSVFIYPLDAETSDINVTVCGLSWMMSVFQVVLSLGFLTAMWAENPLPHNHLVFCSLLILFEWLFALHTMGVATSTISVTLFARRHGVVVPEFKNTILYGLFVFVAGALATCAAFLNIIFAKNLRHPPAANNQH